MKATGWFKLPATIHLLCKFAFPAVKINVTNMSLIVLERNELSSLN